MEGEACPVGVRNSTNIENLSEQHSKFVEECKGVREALFRKLDRPSWLVSWLITLLTTLCVSLFQYSQNLRKELDSYGREKHVYQTTVRVSEKSTGDRA